MTEAEKKEQRKKTVKRVWDGSKLIMAIGALTAAINGYTDLRKQSIELSEQNAVAFKALASKVNKMAERMAYMQGRLDGLRDDEAEDAVELKIQKFDAETVIEDAVEKVKRSKKGKPLRTTKPSMSPPPVAADEAMEVEVEAVEVLPQEQPMNASLAIQIDAYEQLPEDIAELQQVQKQIQEQVQEEQ